MKRYISLIFVLILIPGILNSTPAGKNLFKSYSSFRLGVKEQFTEGIGGGLALGMDFYGGSENWIDFGFGFDFYWKNYFSKSSSISKDPVSGIPWRTSREDKQHSVYLIPLKLLLRVNNPPSSTTSVLPYFGLELGYQMLLLNYYNQETSWGWSETDTDFAGGFLFGGFGGVKYLLNRNSALTGTVSYNYSHISHYDDEKNIYQWLPLNSLGLWLGLEFGI